MREWVVEMAVFSRKRRGSGHKNFWKVLKDTASKRIVNIFIIIIIVKLKKIVLHSFRRPSR